VLGALPRFGMELRKSRQASPKAKEIKGFGGRLAWSAQGSDFESR